VAESNSKPPPKKRSGPIDSPREKPKTQREAQSGRLVCRDAGKEAPVPKPVNGFLEIISNFFNERKKVMRTAESDFCPSLRAKGNQVLGNTGERTGIGCFPENVSKIP
jgi:hypothetical protein